MIQIKIDSPSNTDVCQTSGQHKLMRGETKLLCHIKQYQSEERGKQTLILQFKIQSKRIMNDNSAVMWLCCSLNLTSIVYASVPVAK